MKIARNPLIYWIQKIRDYVIKKPKQALLYLVLTFAFIGLSVGYFIYRNNVQIRAHSDFIKALEYFNAPVVGKDASTFSFDKKDFENREEKWKKVEQVFKNSYEKNSSSGLAFAFLAFQSTAVLYQGRQDDAIKLLQRAVDINPNREINSYYKVKLALLKIDSKNQENKRQGFEELKSLALDDKSSSHDWALYEMGNYFWYEKKFEEVKNYWGQLELKYGKSSKKPSHFWQQAKDRFKLIKV